MLESIIVGTAVSAVVKTVFDINSAVNIDEKALKKLCKAHNRRLEAQRLLQLKQEELENALSKVLNRKAGILYTSLKDFVSLYDTIVHIELSEMKALDVVTRPLISSHEIASLRMITSKQIGAMTEHDLRNALFVGGIGYSIKKSSEQDYAVARRELSAANTAYRQAETMATAADIMIEDCNFVATVLAKMNSLFVKSCKHTRQIIGEKGTNKMLYTEEDKGALMTCMNLASALKQIIDAPVMTEEGKITEEIKEITRLGEVFL